MSAPEIGGVGTGAPPYVNDARRTFDYRQAWVQAARPAYEALLNANPQIADALDIVASHYRDIHQDRDHLGIPWRNETDRTFFMLLDTDDLAFASHVIHMVGHWFPGDYGLGSLFRKTFVVPGREWGSTWKFAHLADQALRALLQSKLQTPEFDHVRDDRGWSWQVHQGAVRQCWASRNSWTWVEVMPAAFRSMPKLNAFRSQQQQHYTDNAVWALHERMRLHEREGMPEHGLPPCWWWPERWRPFMDHRFMVTEEQFTSGGATWWSMSK